MPLVSVDTDAGTLVRLCDNCGALETVVLAVIKLGMGKPDRLNPNLMLMPPCACGAAEVMIRNWDVTPEGYRNGAHCEQRAAKNALAQWLKAHNQQHPPAIPVHATETEDPPEMMDLADAKDLMVPDNERVPDHAAWNQHVADRAKCPVITFRTGTRSAVIRGAMSGGSPSDKPITLSGSGSGGVNKNKAAPAKKTASTKNR